MTLDVKVMIIIGLLLSFFIFIYSIYWFVRSILFYSKNGWNFDIEYGPPIYRSEFHDEREKANPRQKIFLFLPLMIFGSAFIAASIIYSLIG